MLQVIFSPCLFIILIYSSELDLIVCKNNIIEVSRLTVSGQFDEINFSSSDLRSGLEPLFEFNIYGRVFALRLFRPKGEKKGNDDFISPSLLNCLIVRSSSGLYGMSTSLRTLLRRQWQSEQVRDCLVAFSLSELTI